MNFRLIQNLEETSSCKSMMSFIGKNISSPKSRTASAIESPADFDVLCGKDKNFKKHPGNKAFSNMIDIMVIPYQQASTKQEKMRFTREIVLEMKKQFNSRFLKKEIVDGKEVWNEIPDQLARDKVSHAIRFAAANPRRSSNELSESPVPSTDTEKSIGNFSSNKNEGFDCKNPGAFEMTRTHDTALGALVQKQQMIMTNSEISGMGEQVHDPNFSRYEDHLDSVRSEDIREFLIEPFGVRHDSKDLEFNSLRTEDLDAIMAEPTPLDEWGERMLE